MRAPIIFTVLSALLLAEANADAATFTADLKDATGRAAANVVVTLEPASGGTTVSHLPEQAAIDQRHEAFVPLVVVVRRGGRVIFTNNDTTKHQVYSFSTIRQFQFVVGQGETSSPVEFPQSGIAAIGCNIHDQMIAYVFVGQTPYAAVTDEKGRAIIPDLLPGRYRLAVWHPQMGVSFSAARAVLDVTDGGAHYDANLPITIETMRGMKHMHVDY
jgi:plastocyanin